MRGRFPVFILLSVVMVITFVVLSQDPTQSERLAEMRRAIAFDGEAREIAMGAVFAALAAFAAYLLFTRR